MKCVNVLRIFSAVLAVALVGCKHNPKAVTVIPNPRTSSPGPVNSSPVERPTRTDSGLAAPPPTDSNANRIPPSLDNNALPPREEEGNYFVDRDIFKQQTVYFDFDRSEVRPGERSKIEAVAAQLRTDPNSHLRVEGHCDERGTPEYNRALGERRALSIREFLISLGIGPERIGTISYGEDKPIDPGHDEAAWAKNRRGEFVLLKPKT
jgi:peptidoglycan-associated lipoprotein